MFVRGQACRSLLVFFVPEFWFPQFNLVPVGVHDPGKSSVLMELWAFYDLNVRGFELGDHLQKIIDSVIDHETRFTGTEPLALSPGKMPCRSPFVFCGVIRPLKSGAAPGLDRHAEMFLIPS